MRHLNVYDSVRRIVDELSDDDPTLLAKGALALRLAAQLDLPEEGKGIAAVARELRFLLADLAITDQGESTADRLDRVLDRMGSPT